MSVSFPLFLFVHHSLQLTGKLCSSFFFKDYQTKIDYITGLITPGSAGINHAIGQDGKVALLTVKLLSTKDKSDLATMKKAARATNKKRFSLSRFGKKEEECHIVA